MAVESCRANTLIAAHHCTRGWSGHSAGACEAHCAPHGMPGSDAKEVRRRRRPGIGRISGWRRDSAQLPQAKPRLESFINNSKISAWSWRESAMKLDRFTKVMLVVIAVLLGIVVLRPM